MKNMIIALVAGAYLSGCAIDPGPAAPRYVEERSGQLIYSRPAADEATIGPRISTPGATIDPPVGVGFGFDGRVNRDESRRR